MNIDYLADRPEFTAELAGWHLREWGHLRPGQTLDQRIDMLSACCGRKAIPTALVASDSQGLLGSALLVEHDMSTRRDLSPWLAGVFVAPSRRGEGVATRLIRGIEAEAAALGVEFLYLYTDREAAFYARRGWRVVEECSYRGIDVTIMSKPLPAPGRRG